MCKEKLDEERKFSFWDWFFNSLTLVKMFPLNTEHIFHGFISKEDAKELLTTKQNSTFLLRFRDSKPGSLSFAYINRGTFDTVLNFRHLFKISFGELTVKLSTVSRRSDVCHCADAVRF